MSREKRSIPCLSFKKKVLVESCGILWGPLVGCPAAPLGPTRMGRGQGRGGWSQRQAGQAQTHPLQAGNNGWKERYRLRGGAAWAQVMGRAQCLGKPMAFPGESRVSTAQCTQAATQALSTGAVDQHYEHLLCYHTLFLLRLGSVFWTLRLQKVGLMTDALNVCLHASVLGNWSLTLKLPQIKGI